MQRSVLTTETGVWRAAAGFTLVELLVVIAITSVLVTLLMAPLQRSMEYTQRAQVAVAAQDASRTVLEQVTREVQEAIFVYDNSQTKLRIPVRDQNGNSVYFDIPYARLDLVPPRVLMHCNNPSHPPETPRDYSPYDVNGYRLAWRACPVDGSQDVEARPVSPVEADSMIVRYFIGLRDPSQPYSNSNENILALGGEPDNTFVLYRAEIPLKAEITRNLFDGPNGKDRPDFFYDTNTAPNGQPFWQNWRDIAKVVGPVKDVDLIRLDVDEATGNVVGVIPSMKFVPNHVLNDPLSPVDTGRVASGEPGSPPTVYRASFGGWSPDFQVRLYRNDMNKVYYTGRTSGGDLMVYKANGGGGGDAIFDITAWETNHTITPAHPELMFTVDPNRGQVSFEFPMGSESWTVDDIKTMNSDFTTKFQNEGAAVRSVQLQGLHDVQGHCPLARIVPGSERVLGPDWTPGANYGKQVLYSRVALLSDDPGPNQYRIDYRDGTIYFFSLLHPSMPEGPGEIQVRYSIQGNQGFGLDTGDVLAADYYTKNVLGIQVAYRIYDDRGKAQVLTLTNNVNVRNFHR